MGLIFEILRALGVALIILIVLMPIVLMMIDR